MQSVSHCSSLQPCHAPSWEDSEVPRGRDTGLDCHHLWSLSGRALIYQRRLVSCGHVGGDICVPHHVMLTQLRATLPTLSLPLCNLFVLTSLPTTGEESLASVPSSLGSNKRRCLAEPVITSELNEAQQTVWPGWQQAERRA